MISPRSVLDRKVTVKNGTGVKPKMHNSVTLDILQSLFHSLWFKSFGTGTAEFSGVFTNGYWWLATEGFTL